MSTRDALARAATRLAVRLLPSHLRERYREQWSADLRDAGEVGLRASSIARGSLAFAVTARSANPFTPPPRVHSVLPPQRVRLAVGLALAAALLALTQAAHPLGLFEFFFPEPVNYLHFLISAVLMLFAVVAPIVAVVLIVGVREVRASVRLAVLLLVLASSAPLLQPTITSWTITTSTDGISANAYVVNGYEAYGAALLLICGAAVLVWNSMFRRPLGESRSRRLSASAMGAACVAVVFAIGLICAVVVWEGRVPFQSSPELPAEAYTQWLALKRSAEGLVAAAFVAWAVVGSVGAGAILAAGFSRAMSRRRLVAATLIVVFLAAVSFAGMLQLLSWMTPTLGIAPVIIEVLAAIGRLGFIGLVLATVGGVRFQGRRSLRREVTPA